MSRTLAKCILPLAAAAVAACATFSRDSFIREKTGDHVYDEKLETLWPEVKAYFKEQGFDVIDAPGEFKLETQWREEMAGSRVAGYWHRYLVEGLPVSNDHARIRVTRLSKRAADHTQYQDTRLGGAGTATTALRGETGDSVDHEDDTGFGAKVAELNEKDRSQSRIDQYAGHRDAERDFALELLLIKRLDPEGAKEIEAAADAAQAAK